MLEAHEFRPRRAEPLYYLAKMYREKGNNELGFYYAMQAFNVGYPIGDKLFIDTQVYSFLIDFEISICGYYLPDRRDMAVAAHLRLKKMCEQLPEDLRRAINNNNKFYLC
jgi:hypothetical protein